MMSERKMYRLSTGLEHQYLTEDSKVRVYLSEVRIQEEKRKTTFEKVILFGLELFYSFSVSYFAGEWAVNYAYMDRGYLAYGSEYLFTGLVFAISFWAINKFLER